MGDPHSRELGTGQPQSWATEGPVEASGSRGEARASTAGGRAVCSTPTWQLLGAACLPLTKGLSGGDRALCFP